jgi:DNA-binding MarR family transcriptional regulator
MWEALHVLQDGLQRVAFELGRAECSQTASEAPAPSLEASRIAREIYRHRRARDRHFPNLAFGEPMWDILLDLYASEGEGKAITVSSACLAASVPSTTALRFLKALEQAGAVERYRLGSDARKTYVRLADSTKLNMTTYLQRHARPAAPE